MTPPKPRNRPHLLVADLDVPPDHAGRVCCSACGVMGRPGEGVHELPVVPEQAVVAARYEHEDGGEG